MLKEEAEILVLGNQHNTTPLPIVQIVEFQTKTANLVQNFIPTNVRMLWGVLRNELP